MGRSVLLVVALSSLLGTTALSGCLEDFAELVDVQAIGSDEAPKTLTVPPLGAGEKGVMKFHYEGYERVDENGNYDQHAEPTPYERDYSVTRTVETLDAHDAWLRPAPAVAITHAYNDADEADNHGLDFESTSSYELATGLALFHDVAYTVVSHVRSCSNNQCSESTTTEEEDSRFYPRDRSEASWGELAGRELHVGETIHFERTFEFLEVAYLITIDYQVLREEQVDGERTFVVSVKNGFERIGGSSDHPEENHHGDVEVSEPVALQWYSERASLPVRWRTEQTLTENGVTRQTRSEGVLASFTPGTAPVAWGSGKALGPPPALSRAKTTDADGFYGADPAFPNMHYQLGAAWRNVRDDLTLRDFQVYRASHPDALPTTALYLPDHEEREFTWLVQLGDTMRARAAAGTRQYHPLPLASSPLYENRDLDLPITHFVKAMDEDDMASRQFLRLREAVNQYRQTEGAEREPAILVQFGRSMWSPEPSEATVELGKATKAFDMDAVSARVTAFQIEDGLIIDLVDGGLRGRNVGAGWYIVYWNALPLIVGLDAISGADGVTFADASTGTAMLPLLPLGR